MSDGHKSRLNDDVMSYCDTNTRDQFLLPPGTSGVTQMHDLGNDRLHRRYEEKKDEIFSEYSEINKEGFTTILGEIWEEWVTPEALVDAAKRVGITDDGLDVNWICEEKFKFAEAILNPIINTKKDCNYIIE